MVIAFAMEFLLSRQGGNCWDFGNIKEKEKSHIGCKAKGVVVFRLFKDSEALFQFAPVIDTLSLVYLTLFKFLLVFSLR